MRFKKYLLNEQELLLEVESNVKEQLNSIKNETGKWETTLKSWILGEDSPFIKKGEGRFYILDKKEIPNDIKKKYPDIIFALQALTLHVAGGRYFDKWEESKKFLTFNKKGNKRTYYRFWTKITEEQLKKLKNGESIYIDAKGKYMSYTYNSKLYVKDKGFTMLTISTEDILQSKGRGLIVVTHHKITPTFDIYHFTLHIFNIAKRIFGTKKLPGLESALMNYSNEREVIGKSIDKITPKDVFGYYKEGSFSTLEQEEYEIKIGEKTYTFTEDMINQLKNSFQKYGKIDYTMFGNSVVIWSDNENSSIKRYADKSTIEKNEKLSKLIGIDVWAGIWR